MHDDATRVLSDTRLIAIDWGTTAARAYRLGEQGRVLDTRHAALGVQHVAPGGFASALATLLGDWQALAVPRLACGMIGSRQGWVEAPYRECPVRISLLAHGLTQTPQRELAIVSGIACRDHAGVPDVMRGEETQVVGLLAQAPHGALAIQPGTHSKWTVVAREDDGDASIRAFATYMTGETFSVLREHTILGRLMQDNSVFERGAFEEGVRRGLESVAAGDLLHYLFGARTRVLFEELAPASAADYLSGVLIGAEVGAGYRWAARQVGQLHDVWLAGGEALCMRYAVALELANLAAHTASPDIAAVGLWRLAKDAALVT